jgi:malonyl-CoA/methylmalonyl-CoA synthetase
MMSNLLYNGLFSRHTDQDTPFLILPSGQEISHRTFLNHVAKFANVLLELGLAPGDRLAVQVNKSTEAVSIYAACIQSGVIFLPLNITYTQTEVEYFIADSGAAAIICDTTRRADLEDIANFHNAALLTLNADGSGSLTDLANVASDHYDTVARGPDDLAAILYTSGTTGRSKGAMLTHENLLSNAKVLSEHWSFTSKDRLLHALPIFHTHGLFVAINISLIAGCPMVFFPSFSVDDLIGEIPSATVLMGVPTFYTRLLGDGRLNSDLVKNMRLFISGSAPLLAETHREFEARTGHRILERYGMTETNMNTSNPYLGSRRAGTVGFPLPGVELEICDPITGIPLPQGEVGMIEVRGPNVFMGYWKMPAKTASELRKNGFFITGDLGLVDEQGYVQIIGRGKDLIISGGYNIYPKEIELVLDDQPGVLESAVIGMPHPDFGEYVLAILIPEPELEPDIDGIFQALGEKLARFKQPRKLLIENALPRNSMGKVQKNLLRAKYANMPIDT